MAIGLVGFTLGYLAYNYAVSHVPVGVAGMALNLIPLFGVVVAVLWLGGGYTSRTGGRSRAAPPRARRPTPDQHLLQGLPAALPRDGQGRHSRAAAGSATVEWRSASPSTRASATVCPSMITTIRWKPLPDRPERPRWPCLPAPRSDHRCPPAARCSRAAAQVGQPNLSPEVLRSLKDCGWPAGYACPTSPAWRSPELLPPYALMATSRAQIYPPIALS
ncbi:EamA family transporter [Streptomyces sp. TM32]|nr:EamA family transporter [Streptomyces sp. TM32]